jgi:chromosome segregation protein
LATDLQRLEGLRTAARHFAERFEQAGRAIARYSDELEHFAGDREKSVQSASEERAKAASIESDLGRAREDVQRLETEVAGIRARYDDAARRLRELEDDLARLSTEIHGREMQLGEQRLTRQNLIEVVRNDLDLDLAALHAEYRPADLDWAAIEEELRDLRERIRRLGNVNLAAIDDLAQVEERLEFLTAQRNDLLHGKQQLSKVLSDIEAESTRLFNDTFVKVREHFQAIFRKLFGGGRADRCSSRSSARTPVPAAFSTRSMRRWTRTTRNVSAGCSTNSSGGPSSCSSHTAAGRWRAPTRSTA